MSFEKYYSIYKNNSGITLRPGKAGAEFEFDGDIKENKRYKLFVVGETSQFYWWKDEPDGKFLYNEITDGLNHEEAELDRYCLDFSAKQPFTYMKRVYKKVLWSPVASYIPINPVPAQWKAGIRVKAENLVINDGGFLQMRFEIRLQKDGVSRRDITVPSDETIILPVLEGTYEYTDIFRNITIPQNAANICVFVEGKNYTGKCYFEHPELSADIHNMLPSFAEPVSGKPEFDWSGQFISRKELPEFSVLLNGEKVYEGEIFERIHRYSEWEINLPRKALKDKNKLEIKLISSYRDALPYKIIELAFLEQPDSPVDIISVSRFAPVGGFARILVRTKAENTTLKFSCESDAVSGNPEYFFAEKGLHGITVDCNKPAQNVSFTLYAEGFEAQGVVESIIYHDEDNVITGTGDMIYIPQSIEEMEEYISWYISNGVGDFVTMRPTYRWSGTKQLGAESVKWFARLMNELEIKYVLMVDGREVPGLNAQPDDGLLAGKNYLGRQGHEYDGATCYWGERIMPNLSAEQAQELQHYAWQEDMEHVTNSRCAKTQIYKGEQLFVLDYRRDVPLDYAKAHEHVMQAYKNIISENMTRHTGPSCMFKYFAQHGLAWLGAETMYSSMEILMGFLRGAAKDYNMRTLGVHHALQWSTTPHNTEEHFKRFRLALYTAYMMGATDINTEEGLWRLEEGYEHHHRFSDGCKGHLKQQQDFYNYTASHTRKGEFYSPVAFVHGRDDGTTFFVYNNIFGKQIPFTSAEKSWELTKEVYPLSNPGRCLYFHKCPTDRPMGFYSGTPYGNVDVIPAEGKAETFADYKLLVYMGYNNLSAEDAGKLVSYIENGGKVLMTKAHLTSTTDIEKVRMGELEFTNNPFDLEGIEGELLTKKIGKGTLYVFNTNNYPYDIREQYASVMKELITQVQSEEYVWAQCGNDVEFSCFKQKDDTTNLYFLAVDWYNPSTAKRKAGLKIGDNEYNVEVPFGELIKVVCYKNVAVWSETETSEILEVSDTGMKVQGIGFAKFCVAKNGEISTYQVDFVAQNVRFVSFNEN